MTDELRRDRLPIPDRKHEGVPPLDARDPAATFPPLEPLAGREGPIAATVPMIFSGDETTDLGRDTASPVADDYSATASRFNGTVNWVQIDVDEAAEDLDHLISPEERLRVAMARQ